MKEQIQKTLDQLLGLELTKTTRAANMECLKFGIELTKDTSDGEINIGQFGLHLQCPWRITQGSDILIGSNDVNEPVDENAVYDPEFNWDRENTNLRDKNIGKLIEQNNLIVKEVNADDFGGFEISFNGDLKL